MLTVMVTTVPVLFWSECFIVSCTSEFAHFRTERMYLQGNWHITEWHSFQWFVKLCN